MIDLLKNSGATDEEMTPVVNDRPVAYILNLHVPNPLLSIPRGVDDLVAELNESV